MQIPADSHDNTHSTASTSDTLSNIIAQDASSDILVPSEITTKRAENTNKTIYHNNKYFSGGSFWQKWYPAFQNILPLYLAIHVTIFAITCLAFLFVVPDSSPQILPLPTLWQQWGHWDAGQYINIATHGYGRILQMAFFPLYPLLERGALTFTQDPILAGLLVSNLAELVMFVALYQLIEEDFNGERAYYSVLYFAIFPSAFFLSAAYTESVFLCLAVLSFYNIRRGHWWVAALFGAFASLTRPDAMFLLVPFGYEYLRRIWPSQATTLRAIFSREQFIRLVKSIRFDILIGLGLITGIILVMFYGYYRFHDPLAFVHAHAFWYRSLHFPGWNMVKAALVIIHHRFVSFLAMRSAIDLGLDLVVLTLVLSLFKLPKRLWSYSLYAAATYLYLQFFPRDDGLLPLESISRLLLGTFPAFIMLPQIRKYRTLNLTYCMLSGALFVFLLTQYLIGHWVP